MGIESDADVGRFEPAIGRAHPFAPGAPQLRNGHPQTMDASDHPEQEPAASPKPASSGLSPREFVGLALAPPTLVTALAYFMGWTLINARASYFGIDPSALGFSTQDYLLRSTDALFAPLGTIIVLALAAAWAYELTKRELDGATVDGTRCIRLRIVARGAIAIGGVLFALGAIAVFEPLSFSPSYLFESASAGFGVALVAYGKYIFDTLGGRSSGRLGCALVCMLVVLSGFWTVWKYANHLGSRQARDLAANLAERPRVIVYAPRRLQLPATVTEQVLDARDSAYRYRYSGMRLLVRSDGKYFVVPDGWTHSGGTAIVLVDSPGLRFEFGAGS
jgi:hypothetical protein